MDIEMEKLEDMSRQVRKGIIETVYKKQQGHLGGPLSVTDILVALYFHEMKIDPQNPRWGERDRFILSKGHSAIALYVTLALRGYFPYEELATFDDIDTRLQAHPDMTRLPALDMSTGSLGQGLSAAVGMALGAKYLEQSFYTYVVVGDGEIQEGQIWEAANVARKYQLDNLIVILDLNHLQQFGWREENGARKPPEERALDKWRGFGWEAWEVDGHDFKAILDVLGTAKQAKNGKPKMIIAQTVKGKGIGFMENQYEWHSKAPTEEEYLEAMSELEEAEADE